MIDQFWIVCSNSQVLQMTSFAQLSKDSFFIFNVQWVLACGFMFFLAQNVTPYCVDSSLLSLQVFLNYIFKCSVQLFCISSLKVPTMHTLALCCLISFSCHFLSPFSSTSFSPPFLVSVICVPRCIFHKVCSSCFFQVGLTFCAFFFSLLFISWSLLTHRHYLLGPSSEFFSYFGFIVLLHRGNFSVSFYSFQNYLGAIFILSVLTFSICW